ncbi:hypothetical protein [Schumannella luteola]
MAAKLTGQDRTLDVLVGLIIVVATLLIGYVSLTALFAYGVAAADANPAGLDVIEFGWMLGLIGSGILFGITTLVWLGRLITGGRSWAPALTGTILVTIALVLSFVIMLAGS